MERITTDKPCGGMSFLNVFYGKDEEVWVRGGGPAPEYKDCSLYDFIRRISKEHGVQVELESDEDLGWQLYDMLEDGPETKEGLIAFFNVAAIQAAEMREHLKEIEDILGDTYDLDRLRELVEADKAGRCVVLPWPFGNTVYEVTISCCKWRDTDNCDLHCSGYGDCWEGENVVQKTTFEPIHISKIGKTVFFTREEAEAALEKMKEAHA